MLVTEISGSWIDAIGPGNRLLWSVHAPVGYPSDAQWLGGGRILLADYSSPGHVLIMTRHGRVLWKYGDGWTIDGLGPDGISARVLDVTRGVVRLQTGYLYHYAFAMLIGVAALITWFMFGGRVS